MLLVDITEMARPAKICPKCGKSMAGNHYWYKGGWHCKKANLKDKEEPKKEEKTEEKKPVSKPEHKEQPKKPEHEEGAEHEADDEDVKAAEKEASKKKKQVGADITKSDIDDIHAETKSEAIAQIDKLFPRATSEQKGRALRVWMALQKNK